MRCVFQGLPPAAPQAIPGDWWPTVGASGGEKRAFCIYSRLFPTIIFLGIGIRRRGRFPLVAQLLLLEAERPDKDMQIYIHSREVGPRVWLYDTLHASWPFGHDCLHGWPPGMGPS